VVAGRGLLSPGRMWRPSGHLGRSPWTLCAGSHWARLLPNRNRENLSSSAPTLIVDSPFRQATSLRDFFNIFQLQPHHLPANAIVALSSFATFCEAYLGLYPTVDLWAKFFSLRPGVLQGGPEVPEGSPKPLAACGSALVIPRRDSIFPRVTCVDTVKKWQRSFFYVQNPNDGADYINLPAFSAATPPAAPEDRLHWKLEADDEDPEVALVVTRLQNMIAGGLTAADLVLTFLSRRVSPLQRRLHKMCHMSGSQDACRHTTFELTKAAVYRRLKLIIKSAIKPEWDFGLAPYSRDYSIPNVSSFPVILIALCYSILSYLFSAFSCSGILS